MFLCTVISVFSAAFTVALFLQDNILFCLAFFLSMFFAYWALDYFGKTLREPKKA